MSSAARPALEFDELATTPSDVVEAVALALECVPIPSGNTRELATREPTSG